MPNSKISRTTPEAQGESQWVPPTGTLGELTRDAHRRSGELPVPSDLDAIAESRSEIPLLSRALRGDAVAIIAEIKRSSPSRGPINLAIHAGKQASTYVQGGAAAISVLTEPTRFGGSDQDIETVRSVVQVPVLKKDFHVTEAQIIHAAQTGASAALIIVRAIDPVHLSSIAKTAENAGIELLFEIRDEVELESAIEAGASMIGVNNRNLETLEIDPETVRRIMRLIPPDCIAVAESGYSSRHDIERAADAGADAVLVGTTVSRSPDPAEAVRVLTGVPRQPR